MSSIHYNYVYVSGRSSDGTILFAAMAFRTSRIFKALDKHDATTPQQVKDLLAAGDDAEIVDASTGTLQPHTFYL